MAEDPRRPAPFSGAVLAGGASSRMGRDKALVDFKGRPLVEVALVALERAGAAEVAVIGGSEDALAPLGHEIVPDLHPGEGPLGAIITALTWANHDVCMVLACDHVATGAPAVTSVVGALGSGDVAVPVVEGRLQTLHAAWRTRARGHLADRFAAGARSVRRGMDGLHIVELLDGDPCWFRDVDTPDQLQRAREDFRQ